MRREVTWQAVVGALIVSAIVAAAYPYVVLKLGMGPNISVVSAFLGALFLGITARATKGANSLQNNIIQVTGTAAASTAFMCVVAAAFGYLDMNESVSVHTQIGPWAMFFWLTLTGFIGVLFTVLFRRHYVDDPKMVFADGIAAAETIKVLDGGTKSEARIMGVTALASALVDWFREGKAVLSNLWIVKPFAAGIEWNLLSIGTGILVGLNVGLSMLLGSLAVAYVIGPFVMDNGIGLEIVRGNIAPQYLTQCDGLFALTSLSSQDAEFFASHCGKMADLQAGKYFPTVMLWAMWPATGLMIAAALTALILKWKALVDTFRALRQRTPEQGRQDVSVKTIVVLGLVLTGLLAIVQKANFGMSIPQTFISILASLPLMLIGIRVLGETNSGPVSLMANALQAVFAVFWPNQVAMNLIGAGIAGNTSAQSEGLMQCFKTGKLVGATPRVITWAAFCAVPIGAAAVAIMYPLLIAKYGLGGDGLSAPTALKISNMSVLLSKGVDAFPRQALDWTIVAVVVGILAECVRHYAPKVGEWVPSPSGFGFALILPGLLNIPMAIGGIGGWVWMKTSPKSFERYAAIVASGFIGGEALIGGLVLPILAACGVI